MGKKILSFILLCLYALGTIGGIGYAIYGGSYAIAVGVAALAYLAYPKAKECFDNLRD